MGPILAQPQETQETNEHLRFSSVSRAAMETDNLDRTDRRLLALLQRNNRRRLRDLADELAISAPTCLRRMRRLESLGVIRAHAALLDASRVGFGVTAHVEVSLLNASGAEMAAFERRSRCRISLAAC
jgi:Lrp/AsnC family transcriptional regulator, leucine-responsive regulatory protein